MKKSLLLLFLFVFSCALLNAQPFKFAWLSDTHIGAPDGYENLVKIVRDINKKDFKFVILSGDITENGFTRDLERVKVMLDSLKIPYHIIPGNHDCKWSESCCTKFASLWGSDRFNFSYEGIRFIGISSAACMRNHGGHVAPETLDWLSETLKSVNKKEKIIIVLHHLLDNELDNWFDLTNRVKGYNVIAMFCGHGHVNEAKTMNGIPAVMARSTLKNKNSWGYNSVWVSRDSLTFYEENGDDKATYLSSIPKNGKYDVKHIDSVQFVNYGANVIANIDLKKTLTYGLYATSQYIATAAFDGTVYCFDVKGNELWNYKTNSRIISRPVICGNTLVAGTVGGELISFDCKSGKMLNYMNTGEMYSSQLIAHKMEVKGKEKDVVFAGTSNGKMICYDLETLTSIWMNPTETGLIEDEPTIIGDRLYYGCWDTYLNCTDINSGKTLWRWQGSDKFYYSPGASKPATDGKSIFIATPDRFVTSIDALTGKTNWRTTEPNCWESIGVSADKKSVLVKGFSNKFYFVSPDKGKIMYSVSLEDNIETMASEVIEQNGNVLFTTVEGMLYRINKEKEISPVMFLGTTKGHPVKIIAENLFAVSGMDGRIVVFSLK